MNDKDSLKELKEKLLLNRENGAKRISEGELKNSFEFAEGYKYFLDKCKTEKECVRYALEAAKKFGFVEFDKNKKYNPGDKIYRINRDRNIILAVIGEDGTKHGVNMAVAHIDAPRLDLKPNPLIEKNELGILKTHYYGGIKKYQWTTIPLAIHGRIVKRDGSFVDVTLGESADEPRFCITDLLPHLAREQMSKKMSEAIMGEDLNLLVGSLPFAATEGTDLVKLNILKLLNEKYGIVESDFISSDLAIVPAAQSCDIGFDRSLIGGYAHDDRSCAYPCLKAILDCNLPRKTTLVMLTDKEETGSDGNTGSQSKFLEYFISELARLDGLHKRDVLPLTQCLSADVNAAYDPTYPSSFEPLNSSYINRGVVVTKYTGSGGKYGTSDATAEFTGQICNMLSNHNVLWQSSELGKVDNGGGGTIAKYIANMNADVIDIGVPVLSMHAPFEVISKIDLYSTFRAVSVFFENH